MSSNNDNAMTRFLFAILKQKNLKDIDWNKVAHDPILAQEITNGHAARMRYSRFRSAMLGLEPTRRNRVGPPKSRVTKSKKDPKAKRDESVKSESAAGSPAPSTQGTPEPSPQKIKQESSQYGFDSRLTPGLTPGPMSAPMTSAPTMSNTPVIQPRLLTPCSDTEGFATSSALASSPASDMMHSQNSFEYFMPASHEHNDPSWYQDPSAFSDALPYDYTSAAYHQHLQQLHNSQAHYALPSQTIEADADHVDVKREEWERLN
ncbi:Uu.00g066000.m01.CDS01 [Anthostomella pinea]|uniref:Uu.00g066000.m01.CDS01 n=1 Tax=Anthostomella pinea TaxID=933095 RepID=A0AAI8VUI1_9PEZI|nr:Uu.00g066000.m01.CDS01 [Anthostomella pinea]